MSEEQRRNIGDFHRGKIVSYETRMKLSKVRKGKNYGYEWRMNIAKSKLGDKNPAWKGGKILKSDGYILVRNPTHPRAMSNGYVFEHILVMEQHLGRNLGGEEEIHHINGIKSDNRIENLKLYKNHSEHIIHHNKNRKVIQDS